MFFALLVFGFGLVDVWMANVFDTFQIISLCDGGGVEDGRFVGVIKVQ